MRYLPATAAWLVLDQRIAIRYELKPLKAAGAAAVLLAAAAAVGSNAFLYERFAVLTRGINEAGTPLTASAARADRRLPAGTALSVLVESYPESQASESPVRELTGWLEAAGHRVYYERVELGAEGWWWRVLAGTYTEQEYEKASWDAARLKAAAPVLQARVIAIASAGRNK